MKRFMNRFVFHLFGIIFFQACGAPMPRDQIGGDSNEKESAQEINNNSGDLSEPPGERSVFDDWEANENDGENSQSSADFDEAATTDLADAPEPDLDAVADPDDASDTDFKWKALLITGDDSINAFDNARVAMRRHFIDIGIEEDDIRELSRKRSQQVGGVKASTAANISHALQGLALGANEGCLIHMTSHGSRQGFYMKGQATLTPSAFAQILDATCGDKPTVVMISACYSGVFINSNAMARSNRIILTAARADRTSFGCSAENEFTYWDGCLIDEFGLAENWRDLQGNVVACINNKETGSGYSRSLPQSFFGTSVTGMAIDGL